MSSVSIKVNIANRDYPMKISGDDQDLVQKAAKLIEQKIKEFEKAYAVKDKQDVLAMCALQFASQVEQKQVDNAIDGKLTQERLQKINDLLLDYLEKK